MALSECPAAQSRVDFVHRCGDGLLHALEDGLTAIEVAFGPRTGWLVQRRREETGPA
jgi:hypothetical protein